MFRNTFLFLLCLAVLTGCDKKRDSPFCLSCEEGLLLYPQEGEGSHTFFVRSPGDTVVVLGINSRSFFREGGAPVCLRMKKARIYPAIYYHPVYHVKCIRTLD